MKSMAASIGFALCCGAIAHGQQDATKEQSEKRLNYMRGAIEALDVKPIDPNSPLATNFNKDPILRFGDLARATFDGGIWKFGNGRPQAIVALELVRIDGEMCLSYEFLCLTGERFRLKTRDRQMWTPEETTFRFQNIDDSRRPHKSPIVRRRQMKKLASRFSASERIGDGTVYKLRLMPQPIDEYVVDDNEDGRQGAIFTLAHGTNPEILLFIEPADESWQFGLARLSAAATTVKFDDRVVWTKKSISSLGNSWKSDYLCHSHVSELAE